MNSSGLHDMPRPPKLELYWCRAAGVDTTGLPLDYPSRVAIPEIPDVELAVLQLDGPACLLCCLPIVGGPFPGLCFEHWLEWKALSQRERRLVEFKRLVKRR